MLVQASIIIGRKFYSIQNVCQFQSYCAKQIISQKRSKRDYGHKTRLNWPSMKNDETIEP